MKCWKNLEYSNQIHVFKLSTPLNDIRKYLGLLVSPHSSSVEMPSTWEGQTNPYIGSLLDDCNPASKEPMYG